MDPTAANASASVPVKAKADFLTVVVGAGVAALYTAEPVNAKLKVVLSQAFGAALRSSIGIRIAPDEPGGIG